MQGEQMSSKPNKADRTHILSDFEAVERVDLRYGIRCAPTIFRLALQFVG